MYPPHIVEWIEAGRAQPIAKSLSDQIAEHLDGLPWHPSKLDWSRMPSSTRANIAESTPEQLLEWARSARIGRHSHAVAYYSPDVGGLILPLEDAITNLDFLFWKSPGIHFVIGANQRDDATIIELDALVEYGDGDWVSATR